MTMSKKLFRFLPVFATLLFPYYFKAVFDSYYWITESKDVQVFVSIVTIFFIGFLSQLLFSQAMND